MDLARSAQGAYQSVFGGQNNLSMAERAGSVILGLAALGAAARRRPGLGALLALGGLAFVARGMSGHCPIKAGMTGRGGYGLLAAGSGQDRPRLGDKSEPYGTDIEGKPATAGIP
ncbi:MAG TPA: hypothetical protein VF342_14130 [Alphaproteobacteria bacterium]